MGIAELMLTAVVLSLDAFAVAVCKGLNMRKINYGQTFLIALFFGGFQALMPFLGWIAGSSFEKYITGVDHWVAFGLLALIGGKMVWEVLFGKDGDGDTENSQFSILELFLLAVATSIDALAVGIAFAFTPGTDIALSVILIGCVTFVLSAAGVAIGNRFGSRYEKKAELVGGIVLILLGIKILIEGLAG